jgi:hypothetical protein
MTNTGKIFTGWLSGGKTYLPGASYTVNGDVSFTAQWMTSLTTTSDVANYLSSAPGGTSAADPVILPVSIDLANDWAGLLTAINSGGKYVALYLSGCTMTGTEFDPDNASSTGKDKIVSLTLPDAAASIPDGSQSSATFSSFTNLKTVSGENVTSIGAYAFYDCTSLSSVSFPLATAIGERAFYNCTNLSSVSFPQAESIGERAFAYCSALSSVSFPQAASIGDFAFAVCTGLSSVSFPEAASIGRAAFNGCTGLSSVSFPEAASIGAHAFYG